MLLGWCGGASVDLIRDFPEERSRLAAIGGTVVFTSIFAIVSSAYALFTVFGWGLWVPVLALLWGAMIFNLDRLIVMTIHGGLFRRLLAAIPRLILASVIAIVIARPLELWIFSPEIEQSLALSKVNERGVATESWKETVGVAQDRYKEAIVTTRSATGVAETQSTFDATIDELRGCENELQKAVSLYHAEIDGSGGTGVRGEGPVAREKKRHYEDVQRRCDVARKDSTEAHAALDLALGRQSEVLKKHAATRDNEIAKADQYLKDKSSAIDSSRGDSLLGRHRELSKLAAQEPSVRMMIFFVIGLFWLVEVLPVVTKLMSGNTIYDSIVAERLEAAWMLRSGSQEVADQQREAGRRAAFLRAQAIRDDAEAEASARNAARTLQYQAISDVIGAARDTWKTPVAEIEEVLARLAVLWRSYLGDAGPRGNTSALKGPAPSRVDLMNGRLLQKPYIRLRPLIVSAAITGGVALISVLTTFALLRLLGGFSKTDLGIAIAAGGLVASLMTVRPFPAILSRLSDPGTGGRE